MKKDPGSISNRIRELRTDRRKMTQLDLAQRVGVSRQTLNAIEGGKHVPSLELAFRIAKELGTPLEEVFTYVRRS